MKAKFNSLNKSNQSIILSVKILNKLTKDIKFKPNCYNKVEIFKYAIYISNSKLNISICVSKHNNKSFYQKIIGSFIYDHSVKYNVSNLEIDCSDTKLLESIVMGFNQKDYIYCVYKSNSQINQFKTTFKLSKVNSFPTIEKPTDLNIRVVSLDITEGDLLLFPGYLPHKVAKNESGQDRIVISFNVGIR